MEKIPHYKQEAVKDVQRATYLLSTTYPLLKEPKTLLTISNHVLSSFLASISALLVHERSQRIIPPYHDTSESKINAFKQHIVKKYNLHEYHDIVDRLLRLSDGYKKAPIAFSRNRQYVICADQFSTVQTISEEDVKKYIKKAKEFITVVDALTPYE
jgi:hypothetical protein